MNSEMEELLDEVRLVYHRIVEVAERLHRSEAVTLGMRAVSEYLLKNGPITVPDIARTRFASGQHIQKLVNVLLKEGLVRLEDNPLHRRSSLVALTTPGESVVLGMRKREATYFEKTTSHRKKSGQQSTRSDPCASRFEHRRINYGHLRKSDACGT